MIHSEVWKQIPGYEGIYDVSSAGRVRSWRVTGHDGISSASKILRSNARKDNYINVVLRNDRLKKAFGIHQLVLLAFVPNIHNKPFANHLNGLRWDNRIENLEWCTNKENLQHAHRTGLCKNHARFWLGKTGENHTRSKAVIQLSLSGEQIAEYPSTRAAAIAVNGDQSTVSLCCIGQRKTHKGFKWEHKINSAKKKI